MKEVSINGTKVMYGTSAKVTRNISNNTTDTFDGPVTEGTDQTSWTIDFSRMRYGGLVSYQEMDEIIESLAKTPGRVVIRETVEVPGEESFTIAETFTGCILSGEDYDLDPVKRTVENFKVDAEARDKNYE